MYIQPKLCFKAIVLNRTLDSIGFNYNNLPLTRFSGCLSNNSFSHPFPHQPIIRSKYPFLFLNARSIIAC